MMGACRHKQWNLLLTAALPLLLLMVSLWPIGWPTTAWLPLIPMYTHPNHKGLTLKWQERKKDILLKISGMERKGVEWNGPNSNQNVKHRFYGCTLNVWGWGTIEFLIRWLLCHQAGVFDLGMTL
jgi:hypothetical protein